MNIVENTFLSLIRLGIGTSKNTKISDDVDWDTLKALADKQGLTAVILDGVNEVLKTNPQLSSLNSQLKLSWIDEVIQNYEKRYAEYEKAICSLAGFYNQHGYKMMVLKGYVCSLDWPKPNHRPCGDIDIWLNGDYKKADDLLKSEKGVKIDNTHRHHTIFYWNDFVIENHYDFLDVHHHKSNSELERIFKNLVHEQFYLAKVKEAKIIIPLPNFHALFLIKHMAGHFAASEINMRQLLDWAFFVKKHFKEINWKWLMEVLDKYKMMIFFNCINAICVDDLGFSSKIFPHIQLDIILRERILCDILSPKFSNVMPKNIVSRICYKICRWENNAWKHELCYKESLWSAFWSGVWTHLLKPKSI